MAKYLGALAAFARGSCLLRREACLIAAAVLFVGAGPASAAVMNAYREIFPAQRVHGLSDEGWQVHAGATAQDAGGSISGTEGRPQDAAPVNSAPTIEDLKYGWGFFSGADVPDPGIALAWTDEIGTLVNIASGNLETVQWYQGNKLATTHVRAALKVDSQWYASVDTFTNNPIASGTDFDTAAELRTLDVLTAQWYALTFDPGMGLSLGQGSSFLLPAGRVTGGGLYFESLTTDSTPRFDSFLITAVIPEPATLPALALGGLLALASFGRRRARNAGRHTGSSPT